MKKIVTTLLCFVAAVACAIGFAACKTDEKTNAAAIDVAGKTFVFVTMYGEFPDDISQEVKDEANNNFTISIGVYKDTLKFIFATDGTYKQTFEMEGEIEEVFHGTYTQKGDKVEITAEEDPTVVVTLTLNGDILTMRTPTEGFTQVQEFKLK